LVAQGMTAYGDPSEILGLSFESYLLLIGLRDDTLSIYSIFFSICFRSDLIYSINTYSLSLLHSSADLM